MKNSHAIQWNGLDEVCVDYGTIKMKQSDAIAKLLKFKDFDTKKCNLLIPQQRPRSKVGMGNALDDVKASSLLDELNHSSNDNSMSSSHTMGCLGIF